MMDSSFWLKAPENQSSLAWCFNPCYDGFLFLTCSSIHKCWRVRQFQSLLWWIPLFDKRHVKHLQKSWNSVSILVMMDSSFWPIFGFACYTCYKVSILVMMDSSFWPQLLDSNNQPFYLFQSLLWWIPLFDSMNTGQQTIVPSFNPCYDGFLFLTYLLVLIPTA